MVIFDTINNFFGDFWLVAKDLLTLLFVIIYTILFFVIQYYLIKGYILLYKLISEKIPIIKEFITLKLSNKTKN